MRILAIRGARLASLEAPFEVDLSLEPLRSAGVFAIVGPTGAGKSSLLDALCLALFDTTPRLERTPRVRLDQPEGAEVDEELSGRDARTLVRRGARDAFAEVDFVGVDGCTYRARWSVERGRTGRLRPAQLSLKDVASGRATAGGKGEVLAAIERKLGLGLSELRRAVLLPQGEVAAFLDAPSDERAVLLERLTGAEIFAEVSRVVHERAAAARRARENVEVTLGMLTRLPPAEVARLEESARAWRIEGARAEERTAALIAHRDALAALARLEEEARQARDALAEIERQRDLADLGRDEVALADRAERAAPERAALVRAIEEERAAGARHAADESAHARAAEEVAPLALAAARLDAERSALAVAHAAARARSEATVGEARGRLSEAAPSLAAELDRLRTRERGLGAVLRELDRWRQLGESERRAREDAAQARECAQAGERQRERLDARALELALDASAQAARMDEARRAREQLVLARSLDAHRAALVPGEPCPLCGACEHPHAARTLAPLVDEAEARLSTIRVALERTRATLAKVQGGVAALRREITVAQARERASEDEAGTARAALAAAVAPLCAAAARVGLVSEPGPALDGEIARASAEIGERARALEAALAEDRRAQVAVAKVEADARAAEMHAAGAREALATQAEAAARAHERAAERERVLAEAARRGRAARDEARAARERAERALDAVLAEIDVRRADAERLLGVDRARVARLRSDLARLDRERVSARTRVEEREARRAEAELRVRDAVAPEGEALDVEIASARAARDDARRREAAAEATLAQERASARRAAELDVALAAARAEEARWTGLDDLVGSADGKRFRAHAQAITLERLIGFANAELAHLAPRFSLARAPLAGELALAVVDREAGHARRTVQSLSGGESFLVSLALALGLAAMTAAEGGRGALRASSLFLDEGLGALDPASLEIALAALEALRASGRQIAIVTHVPQVAERFAARVEVIPRGAGRSDVRVLRA